jgi:SAM-dependent methyltransferase
MMRSALTLPATDATTIFEHFRGAYATELLTVAVAHFQVFEKLATGPLSWEQFRQQTGLAERPAQVLVTALAAMGLLERTANQLQLTAQAREHLLPSGEFYVGDYVGLAAQSPGVLAMRDCLVTNKPFGSAEQTEIATSATTAIEQGTAFIYKPESASAMEQTDSARQLTLALAGRAKNVAPLLARQAQLQDARLLLDVGGGTGIYSIACLQQFPQLRAVVWDRPEVLKVAAEFAAEHSVADRLELIPGDMFHDPLPCSADAILLSNILHDWDVPECQRLIQRCVTALNTAGQLLIHDVLLNDQLTGPLPIALYSAALFTLTEGRAYSAAEYQGWLQDAGLSLQPIRATAIHCAIVAGQKVG